MPRPYGFYLRQQQLRIPVPGVVGGILRRFLPAVQAAQQGQKIVIFRIPDGFRVQKLLFQLRFCPGFAGQISVSQMGLDAKNHSVGRAALPPPWH